MNNSYDSKNKFKEFANNSYYLRVDENHSLELLIGLNDLGQKTIRLIGNYKREKIKSTKTIEVNHFMLQDKIILSFSLQDNDYSDLFYLFCNDIIDSSRNINPEDGYIFIMNRYEKWRGFGSFSRKYLSESEVKGLIGELLFLEDFLIPKYGISKGIIGWTGTEPLKKDFSFEDAWYEVKTATKEIVTISSLEQLDSDYLGYLILYQLEKLSPEAEDINLNKLVDNILTILHNEQDKSSFIMKLIQAGFYREEYYDQFVYRKINVGIYEVNEEFPKLTRDNLPIEISNVKYDLLINMMERFKRETI